MRQGASEEIMKKANRRRTNNEMLPEYDFRGGRRGKYAKRYARGTNVVVLDPDVAQVFKDSETVNRTLRVLADLIRKSSHQ